MNFTQNTLETQNQPENKTIPLYIKIIATGFYSGYAPIAPGTAGSLVGLAIYLLLNFENQAFFSLLTIVTFYIGVLTSREMESILGEDPTSVVIDEIVGLWVSLLFIPKDFFLIIAAFIIFRIYDIIKPQPARHVEKYKRGWGIMLDDVISGIYTNITIHIIIFGINKI